VSQGTEQQQRMQGLPCRGLVDCHGDLFIYAGAVEQIAWIAQALSIRVRVVEVLGLPLKYVEAVPST
jgi:hypothetical protein